MRDTNVDELYTQVEELDEKVIKLINLVKTLTTRLEKIEHFAQKHGVKIDPNDEQCTIV